jgi:hypothetical protein
MDELRALFYFKRNVGVVQSADFEAERICNYFLRRKQNSRICSDTVAL